MKYNFDIMPIRKNKGATKWERMYAENPDLSEDIVPLSMADMEFFNAPELTDGLMEYIKETVLGYTMPTQSYYDAVCGWMKRRHNWVIEKDWIVSTPGVVYALSIAVLAYTKPEDGVIVMPPVYYPMFDVVKRNNRRVVCNELINENNHYTIDFNDLETKASDPVNTMLLLCSPHNPVGRVWTRDELNRIGDICLRYNVLIVSDEIHFDFVLPGYRHTVMANISKAVQDRSIICTAPSKTFNTAGVVASNIIIADGELRSRYSEEMQKLAIRKANMIGLKACEIAYTRCEDWLDELNIYLSKNRKVLKEFIEAQMPYLKLTEMEGTYLQWVDCRQLNFSAERLEEVLHKEACIFLDEGIWFGQNAAGFERINLACPKHVLINALHRIKAVFDKYA